MAHHEKPIGEFDAVEVVVAERLGVDHIDPDTVDQDPVRVRRIDRADARRDDLDRGRHGCLGDGVDVLCGSVDRSESTHDGEAADEGVGTEVQLRESSDGLDQPGRGAVDVAGQNDRLTRHG